MLVAIIGEPSAGKFRERRIVTIERLSTTIPEYDESLLTYTVFNYNDIIQCKTDIMNTRHRRKNIIIDVPTLGYIPVDVRKCVDVIIMTDAQQAIWCMTELNIYPDANNNIISIAFANDNTQKFIMYDRKSRQLQSFGIPSI